jgi:hypothetical protein
MSVILLLRGFYRRPFAGEELPEKKHLNIWNMYISFPFAAIFCAAVFWLNECVHSSTYFSEWNLIDVPGGETPYGLPRHRHETMSMCNEAARFTVWPSGGAPMPK